MDLLHINIELGLLGGFVSFLKLTSNDTPANIKSILYGSKLNFQSDNSSDAEEYFKLNASETPLYVMFPL